MIKPRPEMVDSAENALKSSIRHYLLIDINPSVELVDCIEQLYKAIELLLREIYHQNGEKTKNRDLQYLIDHFWEWEDWQKKLVHELRERGNKSKHEGVYPRDSKDLIKTELLEVYSIGGQIYEGLGYEANDVFNDGECALLEGEDVSWKYKAKELANASLQYYKENVDIAKDMSNEALRIAIRGLAKSWRINDVDLREIPDLVQAMYDNEYVLNADIPISFDPDHLLPFFFSRDSHEYCYLRTDCIDHFEEVFARAKYQPHRVDELFKSALEDNRDVVISFIANAPYLDYFECIVNNWQKITEIFVSNNPELPFPNLNADRGISAWWDEEASITIHFSGTQEDSRWTDTHKELLIGTIQFVCGNKPNDLSLFVEWEGSWDWYRNDIHIIEI